MKYLETKKQKVVAIVIIVLIYSIFFTYFVFNLFLKSETKANTSYLYNLKTDIRTYEQSPNNHKDDDQDSTIKKIPAGADPETFTPIEEPNDGEHYYNCYYHLFKDKDHVFWENQTFEDANPETFRFIGFWNPWAYDAYCVYTDGQYIYFNTEKTDFFDVNSFSIMLTESTYLKDKNGVYSDFSREYKIEGADPETFESSGSVGHDKNSVYYCGVKILPNQPGYEILGNFYGKIDSEVYYKNNIIEGADARSFELFHPMTHFNCFNPDGDYAKDKNNVYFAGKKIEGANLETFTINTSRVGYASDKNGEYNDQGERVQNDFKFCSSNINDLPEGEGFWSKIIPELLLSTNTNKFEFCLLPDGSKLIGYKKTETDKSKTIDWFDEKNILIQTTVLKCENQNQSVGIKSLERLEGNELILSCLKDDACIGRDFYELDLNKFKISPFTSLIKTDEYYDCGYRG